MFILVPTDKLVLSIRGHFSVQQTELTTENYIQSNAELSHLRLRDHCRRESCKTVRDGKREFAASVSPRNIRKATPMKSHQHCCLNMS